jgi:hypothetical protein
MMCQEALGEREAIATPRSLVRWTVLVTQSEEFGSGH